MWFAGQCIPGQHDAHQLSAPGTRMETRRKAKGVERSRGEVSYRESFLQENSLFWRVGEILVGNRESIDFCTPINHYYWNVPEGMRRMNQLHTHIHTHNAKLSPFFFFFSSKEKKETKTGER